LEFAAALVPAGHPDVITGGVESTTVTVAVQVGQVDGTASGSHAEFSAVNVIV
jgi:phosphotransacetylase